MTDVQSTAAFPFAMGCPVWSCDTWGDVVYPRRTPRRDWLAWYSRMFNTVEGNSTYVFTHAPDDKYAPAFARRFANAFTERYNNGHPQLPSLPPGPRQMTLFDDT